jgi:hypothetical protein
MAKVFRTRPLRRGEQPMAQALPEALESMSRSLLFTAHALKLCWIAFSEPSDGSSWLEIIPMINLFLSAQLFRISRLAGSTALGHHQRVRELGIRSERVNWNLQTRRKVASHALRHNHPTRHE